VDEPSERQQQITTSIGHIDWQTHEVRGAIAQTMEFTLDVHSQLICHSRCNKNDGILQECHKTFPRTHTVIYQIMMCSCNCYFNAARRYDRIFNWYVLFHVINRHFVCSILPHAIALAQVMHTNCTETKYNCKQMQFNLCYYY